MLGRTAQPTSKPVVAVWVDYWLPHSETFIANQMAALRRWTPMPIGLSLLEGGLPTVPEFAPFTRALSSRLSRRVLGVRRYLARYRQALDSRHALLVHAHFGPSAVHALPVVEATRLPFVVTFHGYDVSRLPRQPAGRGHLYRGRLRRVFARAERLVAVSHHVKDRLIELGAAEAKITVRYVGAPPARPGRALATRERAGIVFVGRLVEKKGVEDLLRAVAGLPDQLRGTPVQILGSGHRLEGLRRLARSLGVHADFRGRATPEQVSASLEGAAVFCAPSKTARDGDEEGLPVTLIEAAQHGATIVSTRHAGIPEFVRSGQDGLLVDAGDVAALSNALARVLTDRELADALQASAAARARKSFDIGICTAALEDLYDEVLAEGPRGRAE